MGKEKTISKFRKFIETYCYEELLQNVKKGRSAIDIDYSELSKFDYKLGEELLEKPTELFPIFEEAVQEFDVPGAEYPIRVRFYGLPKSQNIGIRNIRSKHLGKLIAVEGLIRQASDIRPKITIATFACPSCGSKILVEQKREKFTKPDRCKCGRKGKFKLEDKKLADIQRLVVEEAPESISGEHPKRMPVLLSEDLLDPKLERRRNPGNKVSVAGVLKEVPVYSSRGSRTTRYDLMVEANHVETIEEEFEEIEITDEEAEEIKKLSKDKKIYEKLTGSIAPSLSGYENIKEAVALQLFGGVRKRRPDGTSARGDIHIFLIGDPGAGKTLHPESRVLLNDGSWKKLGVIAEECMTKPKKRGNDYHQEINHDIFSLGGDGKLSIKKATRAWKKKTGKLFRIETAAGKEIICTETNPLFTCEDARVVAKKTSELGVGDFVATSRKINVGGQRRRISFNQDINIAWPTETSEQLWRFVAYLLSEAYCGQPPKIDFVNNDAVLIDDYESCAHALFGLRAKRKTDKNALRSYIFNSELTKFLYWLEPQILSTSRHKRVPDLLFKCSNSEIRAFLRVFFEAEGHANKKGVELSSASKEMLEQIQTLLLRFGILSQLHSMQKCATNTKLKIKREYYRLSISGKDAKKFAEAIGFISERKNAALREMPATSNTNIDVVPNLAPVLRRARKKLGLTQFDLNIPRTTYQHLERGDRNPSRSTLRSVVAAFEKQIASLHDCLECENIKEIRKILGLSQQKVAELASCSQTLVSMYELNKTPKVQKSKILTALRGYILDLLQSDEIFYISHLRKLAHSDIFWDKIVSISEVEEKPEWIYDLEVDGTHNFVANNFLVHNSELLRYVSTLAPKARYVVGKSASGAGITVAVVKDEFTGGWALEAGALVLADKGILCLDEMDKMSSDDRSAMHSAMEQQIISVSKANIQATLNTRTTILAAANPKFGRFDPFSPIPSQIELPSTLVNRFDLLFPIRDIPDKENDEKIASHVLTLHQKEGEIKGDIDPLLLKKYIAYAKQTCFPKLTDKALEEIKNFYVTLRNSATSSEENVKSIPISARQLQALVRLAEASARVRLSSKVYKKDAQKAIDLLKSCMQAVGTDPETGEFDIDRITTGVTAKQRSNISVMRQVIEDLSEKYGKVLPIQDVIDTSVEAGLDKQKAKEIVEALKRKGDIFEPKQGYVQKVS